jgi:hypothetical protein
MQIHEVTRKRPIKEASVGGALGGAASVIGGIASQLVNKAATSQGLNPVFGGQQKATVAGAQSAATAANNPLVKGLATAAQKEWKQTVSELMQKMKTPAGLMATRPSELPPAQLQKTLGDLVSRLIGEPYESLETSISAEARNGQGKQYAAELKDTIDEQIAAIITQEQTAEKPDPNKESALWTTLAQAIAGAKSELEFSVASGRGVAARPGLLPPEAQQLASKTKMSAETVAALKDYVKQNGNKITPALAALVGANDPNFRQAAE